LKGNNPVKGFLPINYRDRFTPCKFEVKDNLSVGVSESLSSGWGKQIFQKKGGDPKGPKSAVGETIEENRDR